MDILLWAIIGIMAVIIIILVIRIVLLRKSAKEIETAFADRLITDTNTLIDISSSDKYMRSLASSINVQLRRLRDERHRFVQGDAELKNAVTNISHDLRTPLTAIFGYLDLLEKQEKTPETEKYLKIIGERCESLKSLTEELFKYSVILTVDGEMKPERMIINNVLEESVAGYYATLVEHNIVPEINLPDKKVVCLADRSALSRIFSNLLNNTVKYSSGDLSIILDEHGKIVFQILLPGLMRCRFKGFLTGFIPLKVPENQRGLVLRFPARWLNRWAAVCPQSIWTTD